MQDCHFVSCLITYITLTILVSKDFCHLLITFANSKDPDLEREESILILIQKDWHSNSVFLKEFIEKSNFYKKKSADDKKV